MLFVPSSAVTEIIFALHSCSFTSNKIVITFCLPSCVGQETAKGPCGLRVKLPPVYHTRWRFHIVPINVER